MEGESFRRISREDVTPDIRLKSTSSVSSDCIIEQDLAGKFYAAQEFEVLCAPLYSAFVIAAQTTEPFLSKSKFSSL